MAKISISRAEMETHITWDAEQKQATLYTCDPVTMRKLDKMVNTCPDVYKCIWEGQNPTAKRYTFPARFVRFGKPASEAQITARQHNMQKAMSVQNNATA